MPTFAETLQRALAGKVGAQKLSNLTDIPKGTIESWLQGRVQRPQTWQPIVVIAQALLLSREETDTLLQAAQQPTIAELVTCLAADHSDRRYLQSWLTSAPLPPSARHQLRAPVGDFVGRTNEIATLRAALLQAADTGSTAAITGVQGMGGIGKTELAYVVAQQLRHAFPDAQIVMALGGTSSSPLTREQTLQTVLRAFIPEAKLPDDLPTLEALYRSQLDCKRVLLLADDAASAAQVEPLLPPTGCALLVTSRVCLTLPAMITIDLEQLLPIEAIHLLRTICSRLTEDEAVALARACGCLPLALRVSASLLRSSPALEVDDYLAQLADERRRLALLRDPDEPQRDVEAALALSYTQLDSTAQTVFCQLGVFAADFATELAQAVVVVDAEADVADILRLLVRRNLVLYDAEHGRWRLHDLVRDLARQRLEAQGEAEATQWRYASATVAIAEQIQEQYLAGGDMVLAALARFDVERTHFDAARQWANAHTGMSSGDQLLLDVARAIRFIGELRHDRRQESISMWENVRTAAKRLGNRVEEARALNNLGLAYCGLGEPSKAISYFEQSLAIAREQGDRSSEGIALGNLGIAYTQLGELHTAISYYKQQLAIVRNIGDRPHEGSALNNLGEAYYKLGKPSKAINYNQQALAIARELGHRYGECRTLSNLGYAYAELGDTRRAIDTCTAALSIAQAMGDRRQEGCILSYLARIQVLLGDIVQATTTTTQALKLLQEVGDRRGVAECQWSLGLFLVQQDKLAQALPLLRTAVAYEQEIGHAKAKEHAALIANLEVGKGCCRNCTSH